MAKIEPKHVKSIENNEITVTVTQHQLNDLLGYIAKEANHTRSSRLEDELQNLYEYLEGIEANLKC